MRRRRRLRLSILLRRSPSSSRQGTQVWAVHCWCCRRKAHGSPCLIGDKKYVVKPDRQVNSALVSAVAKAYRWQEQLESGQYASLEELAAANGVDRTYVSRILRLTSLSPEIVERILDGDEPEGVSLRRLQKDLPLAWSDQGSVARVRPEGSPAPIFKNGSRLSVFATSVLDTAASWKLCLAAGVCPASATGRRSHTHASAVCAPSCQPKYASVRMAT